MPTTDRQTARRRALRAAQLVTLSLSLATGCGAATALKIGDGGVADAGHDAGRDAGTDATMCNDPTAPCGPADRRCNLSCPTFGYDPDCCDCHAPSGCAVTGPFVPPEMGSLT